MVTFYFLIYYLKNIAMIEHYNITPEMVHRLLEKLKEQINLSNELGKNHHHENNSFEPKL